MKDIPEKRKLREFLERRGIAITNKRPPRIRCPHPDHLDETPTAVLYEDGDIPRIHCPICTGSWTIIDVCGMLDNITDFPEILKRVRETLNITEPIKTDSPPPAQKKQKPAPVPLPFPDDKKEEFNKQIEDKAIKKDWGKVAGSWKYYDTDGNTVAIDVRFEDKEKKKTIITFWYDGTLKWYGAPVFIYNLHLMKSRPGDLVVINEGSKCADILNENISDLLGISWSGGSGKAHLADWSALSDREVFILPDDDQQRYPDDYSDKKLARHIKPKKDQPGYRAALKIQKQITHAKIIKPVIKARDVKRDGADIEEILQIMTPEVLTAYILNPENIESSEVVPSENPPGSSANPLEGPPPHQDAGGATSDDSIPFKILGIGEDGKANFIDQWGYHHAEKLTTLSKGILNNLADLTFWRNEYPNSKNGVLWDEAINYVISVSKLLYFDSESLRGRGAWKDGNKYSYHDGHKTYGEHDPDKIYLRLPRKDIGINKPSVNHEIPLKIKNLVFQMSFETRADIVRCLAWSVLAPFAGALEYRPSVLLTGPSSSGKSKVQLLIIKKISNCIWLDATESSIAGVRGKVQKDACAIFFEEAEKDTEKKKINVTSIYSLMRTNYSEDSPDTVKGTSDGKFVSYKMNSMFGFASVDPTVDSIADENRIFRINMVKPLNGAQWKSIQDGLLNLLTKKNCDGIRSLTWKKLKIILKLSERITEITEKKSGYGDYRYSFADAMLAAAFIVIWDGDDNPSDEQIDEMLDKYYSFQVPEERRDESAEIIDRLMNESIEILHDFSREKITIMECLNRIYYGCVKTESEDTVLAEKIISESEILQYKLHVSRIGIRLVDKSNIAIMNNHHIIMKIIGRGPGYNKLFKRHSGFLEGQRNVHFYDGKSRRCTVLKGIIKKKDEDMTGDDELEMLFE